MSDWRPIETAPKDDTPMLLFTPNEGRWIGSRRWEPVVMTWRVVVKDEPQEDQYYPGEPTHWMPLPDPPEGFPGRTKP